MAEPTPSAPHDAIRPQADRVTRRSVDLRGASVDRRNTADRLEQQPVEVGSTDHERVIEAGP